MITADILYLAACLLLTGGHYAAWRGGAIVKYPLLRFTALLPFAGTLFSLLMADWETALIPAYLGTALYSLSFVSDSAKRFLPAAAAALTGFLAAGAFCLTCSDYRLPVYYEEFNTMFGIMKKHYVLTDYKQTDFDALYSKYAPQIKALERDSDDDFFRLCYEFTNEFNDLHVMALNRNSRDSQAAIRGIQAELCGKDPGFTAVRLSDGRVLACCVSEESDAYKAGLRCGCELVSFNSTEINEYIDSSESEYMPFADKDNRDFCRPITAFGVKGTTANVEFIGEDGGTVTADITPNGSYSDRIRQAMQMLFGEYDKENNYIMKDLGGGTAYVEINDFVALPAVKREKFGDGFWDKVRKMHDEGKYSVPQIYLYMEDLMQELNDAGISKLIIDMRNNGGGSVGYVSAVADFFTDKPIFLAAEEYTNKTTGRTVRPEPIKTEGNYGTWKGEVVILVSPNTVSAAEIFSRAMQKLPNVTVMGFTDTAGSAMGVSGAVTDMIYYQFPMYKMIDEDGNILIDSGADMQSSLQRDVKIDLDEQAFRAVFVDKTDYTVDFAKNYLTEKAG